MNFQFGKLALVFVLGAVVVVSLGLSLPRDQRRSKTELEPQDPATKTSDETTTPPAEDLFPPVDSMHHFMEYICEPSYKELQQLLATEPADRNAWKAFKNHALVLAESSALIAQRGPEEADQSKQWKKISVAVYNSGKSLYQSAGDYSEAKKHYGLMIDQCNQCHAEFAEGKHQLKK